MDLTTPDPLTNTRTPLIRATGLPCFLVLLLTGIGLPGASGNPVVLPADFKPAVVGTFSQQVFRPAAEVPSPALSILAQGGPDEPVWVGTAQGLYHGEADSWKPVEGTEGKPVSSLALSTSGLLGLMEGSLVRFGDRIETLAPLPESNEGAILGGSKGSKKVFLGTASGLFEWNGEKGFETSELNALLGEGKEIRQIAFGPKGEIAVAAREGLFLGTAQGWSRLDPVDSQGEKIQMLYDVRGVAYDGEGTLWAATPREIVSRDPEWTIIEKDRFPYNDFTCIAGGLNGVWFGTRIGAFRYDGKAWEYRQGRRWLPGDEVADISIDSEGNAWFATDGGAGQIEFVPMTLAKKADLYETLIDQYNRRTEFGYVLEAHVEKAGDLSSGVTNSDSDNDGLWTAMYGAGECYAYGATKDPKAKQRATQAFEALRFLSLAPVGGDVGNQPGYVARTVLPTDGPNPNLERGYTLEGMKEHRDSGDSLWKIYFPRWGKSADGKYWYKTDTSSDELDGHYFFYPLYYDLVAETSQEKESVREVVRNLTDHLLRNNYCLVDHDGTPTRWSDYSPENLNHNHLWYNERGLKSLSMLAYLLAAQHVTGDPKYGEAADALCRDHAYDTNAMVTKIQTGAGSGNQSDDEMAIMGYYNLLKYNDDPQLQQEMTYSFRKYWVLEEPELNPFFNFAYAAFGLGFEYTNPWGTRDISPWEGWLEDSVDTLKRFPLDLFDWGHTNSHRTDAIRLSRQSAVEPYETGGRRRSNRGYLSNGKVLPVDERHFNHWNTDPWRLDQGGSGRGLSDGAVFLLPYYMGLYHGFIVEK